jgi:hypothetical protein
MKNWRTTARTIRASMRVSVGGLAVAAVGLLLLAAGTGCKGDARLKDKNLRNPTVHAVTHYGQTLDEQADPRQVAYALLRAMHDDMTAADQAAREQAMDVQFDLCAADWLAESNRTVLSREEYLYTLISTWTPTVGHYVDGFPATWEEAEGRLVRIAAANALYDEVPACAVLLEVVPRDGNRRAQVVLAVWLVEDKGFWRVTHVSYMPPYRSIAAARGAGSKAGLDPAARAIPQPTPTGAPSPDDDAASTRPDAASGGFADPDEMGAPSALESNTKPDQP